MYTCTQRHRAYIDADAKAEGRVWGEARVRTQVKSKVKVKVKVKVKPGLIQPSLYKLKSAIAFKVTLSLINDIYAGLVLAW